MTSPKVVAKCKFDFALQNPDRRLSYNQSKVDNDIKGMFNYFSNVKKRAVNMFDYFEGKINKDKLVNLVIENVEYASEEEIAKRKKDYVKYIEKSNLWKGFVSFNDNDYIDNSIELSNLEQKVVKEVFPKFFRYCGFDDPKKMSYQIAIHTNTKHYHFHFSFIEKEPNYKCSDGSINYRRKGLITNKELNFLKNEIIHVIDRHREFTPLVVSSNNQIEDLKKYFKPGERNYVLKNIDDLVLEENMLRLGKMLSEARDGKKGRIKYNSIYNKEIKDLTKSIKKYLFSNKNSELYKKDKEFQESLNKINDYFYSINNENGIKKKRYISDYSKNKEKYIDNYIYNAIVNHASYKFIKLKDKNKGISDNEILQEAILKAYKKNKKQSKYDLLVSYLSSTNKSNQFKTKYKVEQSIKKINEEMDEAVSEFSKLFETEKNNSNY